MLKKYVWVGIFRRESMVGIQTMKPQMQESSGAGETTQCLRALGARAEDPGSGPALTRQLPTICSSSYRGSDTLFWPKYWLYYLRLRVLNSTKSQLGRLTRR